LSSGGERWQTVANGGKRSTAVSRLNAPFIDGGAWVAARRGGDLRYQDGAYRRITGVGQQPKSLSVCRYRKTGDFAQAAMPCEQQ